MKTETLNEMIACYRNLKEISCKLGKTEIFNIVTSEEEFINNIKMIDLLYKGFWENEKEGDLIKSTKILYPVDFSRKHIENKKVYLKYIVGFTNANYSFLPWIIALPALKRFYRNFPRTEEKKKNYLIR